jgi:hypothetical protein
MVYYECHRSNNQNCTSSCSQRAPKLSGSIKLVGVCSSRMKVEFSAHSSEVHVEYIKTHVGHTLDLKCQPLISTEKQIIIIRISKNYSCYKQHNLKLVTRNIRDYCRSWMEDGDHPPLQKVT